MHVEINNSDKRRIKYPITISRVSDGTCGRNAVASKRPTITPMRGNSFDVLDVLLYLSFLILEMAIKINPTAHRSRRNKKKTDNSLFEPDPIIWLAPTLKMIAIYKKPTPSITNFLGGES